MSEMAAGEQLLAELQGGPSVKASNAPTMGVLKKVSYTHEAMIELMISQPNLDQNHLAAHFGYTASWISNILASDAFQAKLASRREEVIDPVLRASLKERFEALARQSLDKLQARLESSSCPDQVILRAAELGAKATGFGGGTPATPTVPQEDRLERLAERLLRLQTTVRERVIDGQVLETSTEKV